MWLHCFLGFNFICKLHSWSNGNFPEVCDSMRPLHGDGDTETPPLTSEPPFTVSYHLGSNVGDPVTVSLQSKTDAKFRGFMLEARSLTSGGDGPPLGKFILLEATQTRLLKCGTLVDSAVSNKLNVRKSLIRVNWTREGEEGDIMFRATFLQEFYSYWERVNITLSGPTSTQKPEPTTATPTTQMSTAKPGTTTTATPTNQMSTAEPGTTTTATPTTQMSTAEPGTTTTATPTTQMSTAEPGTTTTATPTTQMSTAKPGTTTTATPTTQMSTAKPGTTTTATPTNQMSTAEPGTTTTAKLPRFRSSIKDLIVGNSIVVFVEWKMELCNIIMALLPTCFGHFLIKITRTVGSLCSFSLSLTLTFILKWGSVEGVFIGLISAILVIGFINLVIVLLPFGPSHELNGHCDLGLRLCCALYHLLTNCFLHVKVYYLTEDWKETGRKIWLLYILIVQTVLIILAIVWNFVLYCNKRTLLHKVRAKGINGDHQGIKKFLRTCTVPFISLFFLVGITSISLWNIVELYYMQDD